MSDKLSARENTLVGKTTSDIYVDLDLDGQDDWDRVYEIIDRVFGNTRQAALPDDTLDKAAYIAATICAHGYLQNTEDEGRVAHVIRQSLAALPDDADPQAGDVETIAEGADEALCVNCGRPHDDHHPHSACPHVDGSGFSLNQHFRRQRPLTDCDISALAEEVDLLEELSDETGKLAADLGEIGTEAEK